jgi:hypothetical protein
MEEFMRYAIEAKPSILEMTISPELEDQFKGEPFFLEIEMLQGKREIKPDGRIYFELDIDDVDKVRTVKLFILHMMSQSTPLHQN